MGLSGMDVLARWRQVLVIASVGPWESVGGDIKFLRLKQLAVVSRPTACKQPLLALCCHPAPPSADSVRVAGVSLGRIGDRWLCP